MQTKKQFIIQILKHAIVGASFGYWFYNLCGFREFPAGEIIGGIIICEILAGLIGAAIEMAQSKCFGASFDLMDVFVTALGATIGALLSHIAFNNTALWIGSGIGIATGLHELYLYWNILRKR